jgi:DNA-binding CsgD family transcriptional regulator
MQTDDNNPILSQIQPILTQFKHGLDQISLIILAINGQVRFMTQRVEYLLNQYFSPHILPALPENLQHWFNHQISQLSCNVDESSPCLSLNIEKGEKKLVINLVSDPIREQYLLLLNEKEIQPLSITLLELLGVTRREAEVLFWISKDKSNANIAKLLVCSEGTVRKHLENIYKKLGVQTRIGAVMLALERLGLLKG